MPFYPDSDLDEGLPYEIEMYWEHVIADYLGMTVADVLDFDIVDYLALRREAFIAKMSTTKEGREYLENCKLYEAEDADYSAVEELQKVLGGAV